MSAKLTFEIKPTSTIAKQLAHHHEQLLGSTPANKMRRTVYNWTTPVTHDQLEIVLNQPGEKSSAQDISYTISVRVASVLASQLALVENTVFKPAACVLPLFRTWLRKTLPDLTPEVLAGITADQCQILEVTGTYYFKYPSESAAFGALCKFYQHCLACLTSSDPYPGTKSRAQQRAPRLRTIEDDSHALSVELVHVPAQEQFGQVRAYLMRDAASQPKSFANQPPHLRESLRASARCLLCFDVTIDASKNLHFGKDKDFQMPLDFRHWTPSQMPHDPFWVIWEATRYALWLNLPMPTEESAIEMDKLDQGEREVLQSYLEGKNLRQNEWIESPEALLHYRKRLLETVNVDVLMPWAIAQLNLCQELGDQFTYAGRFRPGEDAMFQAHCLSVGNAEAHVAALLEKLPELATAEDAWPRAATVKSPRA